MLNIPAAKPGWARGSTPGAAGAIVRGRAASDVNVKVGMSDVVVAMSSTVAVRNARSRRSQCGKGDDGDLEFGMSVNGPS